MNHPDREESSASPQDDWDAPLLPVVVTSLVGGTEFTAYPMDDLHQALNDESVYKAGYSDRHAKL